MKKLISILLLTTAFTLSCTKNNSSARTAVPDGTSGVDIDAQGNLIIDAPLYMLINKDVTNPELQKADASLVETVEAVISSRENYHSIASGTISGGRISITVPIPDRKYLLTADSLFETDMVQSGADVMIEFINLSGIDGYILLFGNLHDQNNPGDVLYDIFAGGDRYYFMYSEGDVLISGIKTYPHGDVYDLKETINIKLVEGWNIICVSRYDDNENYTSILSEVSKKPPSKGVWVMW